MLHVAYEWKISDNYNKVMKFQSAKYWYLFANPVTITFTRGFPNFLYCSHSTFGTTKMF